MGISTISTEDLIMIINTDTKRPTGMQCGNMGQSDGLHAVGREEWQEILHGNQNND